MARKKTPEQPEFPAEIEYTTADTMPLEIKEMIYHAWLPRVAAALLKGVRQLPPEQREPILMKMGKACGELACAVCGIRSGMSWEEYEKHMTSLPPPLGPRRIKRIKDAVEVDYQVPIVEDKPVCQCPMILLGMIEPVPEHCICGAHLGAMFIEAAGIPTATVELLGSPHSGLRTCRYRVHLKHPTASAPTE